MSVSPSAQKVDDFLSKISAISQQRLRDNQKTQRELNSLRGSSLAADGVHGAKSADLGISELRFNRSKRSEFYEEWRKKEIPPPMPARPGQAPVKPEKPTSLGVTTPSASDVAPKLPKRPEERENPPVLPKRPQYTVNLSVPVARVPEKPEALKQPDRIALESLTKVPETIKVSDISTKFSENVPKVSDLSTKFSQKTTNVSQSASKVPQHPSVKTKVSGSHAIQSFLDIEEDIKRGDKPLILSTAKEAAGKPDKTEPVKPPKPPKFQNKESEMLHEKIRSLSPTKRRPEVSSKPNENAAVQLKSTVRGLKPAPSVLRPAPKKPSKPQALAVEHEALLALEKLKKPAAVQQKRPSIPEAMLKLQSIKQKPNHLRASPGKDSEPRSNMLEDSKNDKLEHLKNDKSNIKDANNEHLKDANNEHFKDANNSSKDPKDGVSPARKLDFQAQLANVLRAQTDPSLGANAPKEIRRSKTSPETPSSNDGKLTHPNKSRAKGPRRKLPKSVGERPKSESQEVPIATKPEKPKKVPPPKSKKPNFEVQNRFNSEIFI